MCMDPKTKAEQLNIQISQHNAETESRWDDNIYSSILYSVSQNKLVK